MKCNGCSAVMPFMEDSPEGFDCIYCDKRQYPDALDLLSQPALGFVHEMRLGQISLTESITDNIRDAGAAMYEAGTGVGKSFAYLLPAIMSGKRTIISTAKKALQAQLIEKDLPHIQAHLRKINHPQCSFKFFVGYGKSNYACYLRAQREKGGSKEWSKYEKFFQKSDYGRWEDGEKLHLKLDQSLSAEDCIGAECKHYKSCGYVRARKEMLDANVVVTNNWLLGYHYKLRQEMPHFHLLGEFEHVIIDEAHKVEDGIRDAFTYQTNLNFIDSLKKQFEGLQGHAEKKVELPELDALVPVWQDTFKELQLVYAAGDNKLTTKAAACVVDTVKRTEQIGVKLLSTEFLNGVFQGPVAGPQRLLVERWQGNPSEEKEDTGFLTNLAGFPTSEDDQLSFIALDKLLGSLKDCMTTFTSVISSPKNRTWALDQSIFRGKTNYFLKSMPVNIGAYLPEKNITYLSATLALDAKFDDFAKRVGLSFKPYTAEVFPSPFDLRKQAHLFVPKREGMPFPDTFGGEAQQAFRDALGEHVCQLIYASQGDAFVLFSSKAELEHVKQYLHSKMFPYPIYAQGEFSAEDALARYRVTPKATLLGLKSFWEGVDVSGDKLFLVIICKLPFPNARDPIVKARKEEIDSKNNGGSSFAFVDVPDMLFDLRQGVGRLIRSQKDRGMIAILDSRIHHKPYGKGVLRTIGLNPHTDLERVCKGLATRHARQSTD